MSLRVWLPLTKDLRNQGLSDVTVTNNGATYSSTGGKLGGCYSFGTGASAISLPTSTFTSLTGDFSVACWVKIISWNTSYATIWAATSTSASWSNIMAGLFRNGSSSKILFCIGNDSSSTQASCITTEDIQLNTWYHFVCTYTSGKICLYQNGNLVSSYNTSIIPKFSATQYFNIGKMRENTYQTNSSINDFRLYDHCLSPMEVKELAKGLVLHYPLNRQGWGQENLFNWSNNATGITLYDYRNVGSFTQFTNSLTFDPSTTVGKKYTISFWAKSPNGTTPLQLYNANSNPEYFYFSTTLTSSLGTEWQFFKYTVTNTQYSGSGTASTNANIWKRIEIYAPNQMKVQVKQIKVEEGEIATPWCPNSSDALATTMGLNGTTEYDTSGFCNNGIKNNLPTYSSDTAKYTVSTHLDGVNQTIQLPNLLTLIPDSIFTFNIWFKRLQSEPSSKPWETLFGGPSGFEIETCSANNIHDNKIRAYSWGSGMFEFEFDKWNMLTMVSNGTNALFYLNGELKLTGTYKALVSGNYFIGSWSNTSTQNYKGYVCDARIYATALSADDVKSLYQNSAYIDSSGNVYGAVHMEA